MQGKAVWEVSMYIPLKTDLDPLYKKGESPLSIHSSNTWVATQRIHNVARREEEPHSS